LAKVREELERADRGEETGAPQRIEHELGDLLFAVANLGRSLKAHPEERCVEPCAAFESRFQHIERAAGRGAKVAARVTLAEMDALWNEAKEREKSRIDTLSRPCPQPRTRMWRSCGFHPVERRAQSGWSVSSCGEGLRRGKRACGAEVDCCAGAVADCVKPAGVATAGGAIRGKPWGRANFPKWSRVDSREPGAICVAPFRRQEAVHPGAFGGQHAFGREAEPASP